jgi:hypothetical protein
MPVLRSRAKWAAAICAATRKTVEAMVEVGKLLTAAKKQLRHGEFIKMIELDLPFGPRQARRFMAIARNPELRKRTNWSVLPPRLSSLAELGRLSPQALRLRIKSGSVHPAMRRKDVVRPTALEVIHAAGSERHLDDDEIRAAYLGQVWLNVDETLRAAARSARHDPAELAAAAPGNKQKLLADLDAAIAFLTALREALELEYPRARDGAGGTVVSFPRGE